MECQGKSRRQLQAGSRNQGKEPLVGSGSRGMRKAEGLAPTSWRVAQKLMNFLNQTLNLNLISSVHEWAPVVEEHVKLVDRPVEFMLNLINFMFIPPECNTIIALYFLCPPDIPNIPNTKHTYTV